jgi:hypothetical protein
MNPKSILWPVLALGLVVPALADLDVSIAAEIRLGKVVAPPPPEIIVIEDAGPPGPPPWAPAHGFRRNRGYYYYPGTHVYYRPSDRMWFYLDGRDWRIGVNLPGHIHVDFDRAVSLTMETDRPYDFHDKVRTYYPADYFITKVRLKEKGGKPDHAKAERVKPDHAKPDRGEDGPSPGKGKGKGKNR